MKLQLEGIYSTLWRNAYLITEKKGRKIVLLSNSRKQKSTISYAKYLMSLKLGRSLLDTEVVEHNDKDVTNDNIDNLKIVTKSECSKSTNLNKITKRLYLKSVTNEKDSHYAVLR